MRVESYEMAIPDQGERCTFLASYTKCPACSELGTVEYPSRIAALGLELIMENSRVEFRSKGFYLMHVTVERRVEIFCQARRIFIRHVYHDCVPPGDY